ncbi:MAG: hypothetical protein ACLP1X_17380, partial [Polyangiaceae bacterium]
MTGRRLHAKTAKTLGPTTVKARKRLRCACGREHLTPATLPREGWVPVGDGSTAGLQPHGTSRTVFF